MNDQLLAYIRQQLAQGVARDDVIRALLAAGWQAADINAALASLDSAAPSTPTDTATPPSSTPVENIPAAASARIPRTTRNVLIAVILVFAVSGTAYGAYFYLRPHNALAEALTGMASLHSFSEQVSGSVNLDSATTTISGTTDVDVDAKAAQGHLDMTISQSSFALTYGMDFVEVPKTTYIRVKYTTNNSLLATSPIMGRLSNWIAVPTNSASSTPFAIVDMPDLNSFFKLNASDIVVKSHSETTDGGVPVERYVVSLTPAYLASLPKTIGNPLGKKSADVTIDVEKGAARIKKIAINESDYAVSITITKTNPALDIQAPSKSVPLSRIGASTGMNIPGFSDASTTSMFGGNYALSMATTTYDTIQVVPLGPVPASDLKTIHDILAADFPGVSVSATSSLPLTPAMAITAPGSPSPQYNASALDRALQDMPINDTTMLIGVTADDISVPFSNFVFSIAARPNLMFNLVPAAVFSTYRLHAFDTSLTASRYRKLLLRMVGLMAGLQPESSLKCVMAQVLSVSALDAKGTNWCNNDVTRLKATGLIPQDANVKALSVSTASGASGLLSASTGKPPSGFLLPTAASIPSGFTALIHRYLPSGTGYAFQYDDYADKNVNNNPASLLISETSDTGKADYNSMYSLFKSEVTPNQPVKSFSHDGLQGAVFEHVTQYGNVIHSYDLILDDHGRVLWISAVDGGKYKFSSAGLINMLNTFSRTP